MKEVIFEANGIEVFIEDGVLVEADDNSRYEFEDTPENREKCIEDAKMESLSIKEIRIKSEMTQKAFAEYFGFSKRAVESWEGGKRECPKYLSDLIEYKLRNEGIIK